MRNQKQKSASGYQYLLAYKLTVPIYDYTVEFCRRWIDYKSRTKDQMEQAARSGMQNIAEGSSQESLACYIKLVGVARGSLEELLNDYKAFARQHRLRIWERGESGKIRELREIWGIIRKTPVLPNTPHFPDLPNTHEAATNLLITLIHQANYFLDKLISSLKSKHEHEGGFSEKLLKKRLEYKKNL